MGAFEKIKTIYSEYIARGGPLEHGSEPAGRVAALYVTQTMLDALAVTGDLRRCLSLMQRYAPAGVTLPLLIPLGYDPIKVVELGRAYLGY